MQTQATSDNLSIGEAALLAGISRDTLKRYERAGKITAVRTPAGHRRFLRADVLALLAPATPAQPAVNPAAE